MAAIDDILATPVAPKPARLPGGVGGVRGYGVSSIGGGNDAFGRPTGKPAIPLAAGEKYPEVRRKAKGKCKRHRGCCRNAITAGGTASDDLC